MHKNAAYLVAWMNDADLKKAVEALSSCLNDANEHREFYEFVDYLIDKRSERAQEITDTLCEPYRSEPKMR